MKIIKLLILILFSFSVFAESLVLKSDGIGPLVLTKETIVSVKSLKALFPNYEITHEIRSGDSPDFHYFNVSDSKSSLFGIISYFETQEQFKSNKGKIDLLKIHTPRIPDQYGIKIGDKFEKIRKNRKDKLDFSAGHFNNNIGGNNIYYSFSLKPNMYIKEANYSYLDPEATTESDAVSQNPEIQGISWPYPAWE